MPYKRAADLLTSHHDTVCLTVARQIQATVPSYELVDIDALAGNVRNVMEGMQILLRRRQERPILGILSVIMEIRQIAGFSVGEFLVAVLCALPVLRRFFVENSSTVEEGLEVYDAVESLILPLYGRVVSNFMRLAEESDTFPDGIPPISVLFDSKTDGLPTTDPLRMVSLKTLLKD